MNVFRKKRFVALAFLAIMLILFYKSTWIGKLIYPIHYRDEIERGAAQFGVDPLLAAAIIRVESNYQSESLSKKGAIGVMQVMPDTAEWIFAMDGFRSYSLKDLNDPKVNIMVGIKYLSILNKEFADNPAKVIAAYNAGQGKVSSWITDNAWDGTFDDAERIPFPETRKYVKSVHYYYRIYDKMYSQELSGKFG